MRAPSIWALANARGQVLLTTSNRSEAAVGYATMDGDTAGGLAPLGGIDKPYLRSWLRWLETAAPVGLAPIPALRAINVQAPTAELRPPVAGANAQTDEADLMPYDVLEAVEDSAIRDKHTPVEVLTELLPRYPQHTPIAARDVDRAVLPPVVSQPVEARAAGALVPPRRPQRGSAVVVPLPHPVGRLRARARRAARLRRRRPRRALIGRARA